jgi:homoserine kinase
VGVPATSANLGVGYDCLGMALDLVATFSFERADEVAITGCEERFRGTDNLVWTTMLTTYAALAADPVPAHIDIDSPIPLSGGLGSSATCVVAGVMAAMELCGSGYDRIRALDIATQIEGHPDNVAPAVLGGLVSSFVDDGDVCSTRYDVAPELRFVAIAPPYEVRTDDARRVVPTTVDTSTAVWQMGRCVATVHALETGDAALLGHACADRLHEPYRARLIPDYDVLRTTALEAGASAFFISGSGSTCIAACDGDTEATSVSQAFAACRPGFWCATLHAANEGARIL